MARLNILKLSGLFSPKTHEGGPARNISPEQALRRSVLACLLWENQFYEDGVEIAGRIAELVPKVSGEKVAALAVEAREEMKLRHAPLLLVREMARQKTQRALVGQTLARVIQRADELAEFVAIYWKDGKTPLSAQVKKGLAGAFAKFDEYQLAKYDRSGPIKLRDVLFLSHAKPRDEAQADVWKRLVEGKLAVPDTWEVALSGGANKREAWERLLRERKLGALALLRNLRNMQKADVEESLERVMLRSLSSAEMLPGKIVLLVDVSGSMTARLSGRSEMLRTDAAYGLAILLREIAERVTVFSFSNHLKEIPPRNGFTLRDAIDASQEHAGTYLGAALERIGEKYDRMIVITDEQAHDRVPNPKGKGYMINVASHKNGVGYGPWTHIDGWSEAVINYIRALEQLEAR
jgi:60 kDa SS-A/Ro ribonucleoprotein